ncbi:HNH endonuclease [Prosthecobacter sp.]|jgi:5-methylcytosine-specific restriction endonuclease McrA|uniref:HNH endonuclease n=1 Tax=Prosthecobacter sp. TaxID=1965333 RepID=UPI003783E167
MEPLARSRHCLREPIPEIADAARLLDAAVTAHLLGRRDVAEQLIRLANMPLLREYTESLWGAKSPHLQFRAVAGAPAHLDHESRAKERMPTRAEETVLFKRDGYHCRFCGIPVIRKEIRERIRKVYSDALPWGRKNIEQHAAFQLMWAVPDHVLPHSRGGSSDLQNTVIVCQPCNCARMHYTLEELGLADPRLREPARSSWDGLERFH